MLDVLMPLSIQKIIQSIESVEYQSNPIVDEKVYSKRCILLYSTSLCGTRFISVSNNRKTALCQKERESGRIGTVYDQLGHRILPVATRADCSIAALATTALHIFSYTLSSLPCSSVGVVTK
jgi:hypothetical protein